MEALCRTRRYQIVSTAHAAVLVTILLEGKLSFGYDDLEFNLDASEKPQGVVVNLAKPANFVVRWSPTTT